MTQAFNRMGWVLAALVSLVALAAMAGMVVAGPLDPPGPVGPTMKTLDQVEPRTPISSVPHAITTGGSYYLTGNLTGISGQNGITISASRVSLDLNGFALIGVPGSLDGIHNASSSEGLSIENGTVTSWGGDGIDVGATNGRIAGVRASNNGGAGIFFNGAGYGTMTECSADNNGGIGIRALATTIIGCQATNNGDAGFLVSYGVLRDCTSFRNDTEGIDSLSQNVIENCSVSENGADGILSGGQNLIRNNLVAGNGLAGSFAGIHSLYGSGDRIEGNSVYANSARGIDVDAGGATIIQNTADNSVNYDIAPGNNVGPIVTGPNDPITSTNPWANFSD